MNAGAKLAAYGLVLAGVLGGGAAVGGAVGPIDVGDGEDHGAMEAMSGMEGMSEGGLPAGGLLVSQDGYSFQVADRTLRTDRAKPFAFTITGPGGAPLEGYDELHDRELHLIVVSSDLARFHHVHPSRDADGTWTVDLPALPAGAYRAFADFQPEGGDQLTLGIDLTVPGPTEAPATKREQRSTEVDGYEVTLDGDLDPSGSSEVTLTVRRDGEVVTTEPYLGAAGHLVAIRDGDLAYLHVHPLDDEPDGPVRFAVEAPSAGTYGFYFDFAHGGDVHSAPFLVTIDGGAGDDGDHPDGEPGERDADDHLDDDSDDSDDSDH